MVKRHDSLRAPKLRIWMKNAVGCVCGTSYIRMLCIECLEMISVGDRYCKVDFVRRKGEPVESLRICNRCWKNLLLLRRKSGNKILLGD